MADFCHHNFMRVLYFGYVFLTNGHTSYLDIIILLSISRLLRTHMHCSRMVGSMYLRETKFFNCAMWWFTYCSIWNNNVLNLFNTIINQWENMWWSFFSFWSLQVFRRRLSFKKRKADSLWGPIGFKIHLSWINISQRTGS